MRECLSFDRAEVTGIKTSFGVGYEPVLTWLEGDRLIVAGVREAAESFSDIISVGILP